MTDTTTIEVPKTLRDELQDRKQHNKEPYYAVIQRELGETDHTRSELVEEIREQLDSLEDTKNQISMANEPGVEIESQTILERLERLESAVKEATQAAQSAEKKVEDLQ